MSTSEADPHTVGRFAERNFCIAPVELYSVLLSAFFIRFLSSAVAILMASRRCPPRATRPLRPTPFLRTIRKHNARS